jgi:hypothetical protein
MQDFSGKRFDVIYKQGTMEVYKIIVDKATGVNYLQITNGYAGGLTVLLDRDGKPVITPIQY